LKIAILSDLHGNLEALRAIAGPFDELWVLGDLVNYGPDPGLVVDWVRANATVVVSGNHDHAAGSGVDPRCSAPFREMARQMQVYTESVLDEQQKAYLRGLPLTARREAGGARFFMCHAAPSDPLFEYAPPTLTALWTQEAAAVDAEILLVGHTHLPFVLHVGGRRVVNPGSVGQAKHGRARACYAVWEDGLITFREEVYDVEATVGKLLALPVGEDIRLGLAEVLRTGLPPR
jgi:putative phosphoesterase